MTNNQIVYDTVCGVCECLDEGKPSSECDPKCDILNTYIDPSGQSLLEQFREFQRLNNSLV